MNSIRMLGSQPASLPILADDILEFHAARLLLLFHVCGSKNKIDGLTKMAKLDFFVRYPQFFAKACQQLGEGQGPGSKSVESAMVRYKYGPWDHRYYHILSYLEGARLIDVSRIGNAFRLELTPEGEEVANRIEKSSAFEELVDQMRRVKKALGSKSGSALKKIIYKTFSQEVASLGHGEIIE